MDFKEFPIGIDDIDRRIDRIVRKFLKEAPLTIIYKNIRSGFIRVNNKKVKNDYKMLENDVLFIENNFFNNNQQSEYKFSNTSISFETIFKNDDILIINKPIGVNVQASTKNDISLDKIIKDDFIRSGKSKDSLSFLPGPLHRLDKNTSGLLVFSQSLVGARFFSEAFVNHSIIKTYICVLHGKLTKNLVLENKIEKNDCSNGFSTVKVSNTNGKIAKSTIIPLKNGNFNNEDITLAKVIIETGRTHQIRSQCAFAGFPLFGDSAYGYKGSANEFFLHAYKLDIKISQLKNFPNQFIAKIPKSFSNFIENYLPNLDLKLIM